MAPRGGLAVSAVRAVERSFLGREHRHVAGLAVGPSASWVAPEASPCVCPASLVCPEDRALRGVCPAGRHTVEGGSADLRHARVCVCVVAGNLCGVRSGGRASPGVRALPWAVGVGCCHRCLWRGVRLADGGGVRVDTEGAEAVRRSAGKRRRVMNNGRQCGDRSPSHTDTEAHNAGLDAFPSPCEPR